MRPRPPHPEIIHADAALLAVNKPAGVLSFPGRGDAPLLADLLRESGLAPADEPCFVVHRLDRDTSGVLLYARTAEARRSLAQQFRRRTVEKTYTALVRGAMERDLEIELPIRTVDGRTRAVVERGRHDEARPALTRVHVLERLGGFTLVECRPKTGRLHQIRVHLAAMGFPLAVDPVYGGGEALWLSAMKAGYRPSRQHPERPLIRRLTLHAASLTIDHPERGERSSFTAELPKDLRATLAQLRRLSGS